MEPTAKYIAFDLYGTLLDTSSIAKKLGEHLPQSANVGAITTEWRRYQLEYSWRLTAMGAYENFEQVTRRSLKHAVTEAGYELNDKSVETVIHAYDQLTVFDDVPVTIKELHSIPGVSAVVFSNGTDTMVGNSIKNCGELKQFAESDLPFVTVDSVEAFKPSPVVYGHLAKQVGKEGKHNEIWLVSGNPFDIVGARKAGFNTIWVDRAGKGWVDQLGKPNNVVKNLKEVIDIVKAA